MIKHALSDTATLLTGTGLGAGMGALLHLASNDKKPKDSSWYKRLLGFSGGGGAVGFALALYNLKMRDYYEREAKDIRPDRSIEALQTLPDSNSTHVTTLDLHSPGIEMHRRLTGLQTSLNNYRNFVREVTAANPSSPLLQQMGAILTNTHTEDDSPYELHRDSNKVWFPRIGLSKSDTPGMYINYGNHPVTQRPLTFWDNITLSPHSSLGAAAHEVGHSKGYLPDTDATLRRPELAEEARATGYALNWLKNLPTMHPNRLDEVRTSIADLLPCYGTYKLSPSTADSYFNTYAVAADALTRLGTTTPWFGKYLTGLQDAGQTFQGISNHWNAWQAPGDLGNPETGEIYAGDSRPRIPAQRAVDTVDDKQYQSVLGGLLDWFDSERKKYE